MSFLSVTNQWLFAAIHNLSGRSAILDGFGIFFADYLAYFLVAGFLVLAYYQEGARRRLYLFAEGALAIILARGIVTNAIQFFYHHARPFDWYGFAPLVAESGASFPSGHAAWFFALAMVVWHADRRWGTWYFILATLMALARVYAGVHWPLDILGGAAIGVGSAAPVRWMLKTARQELQKVPVRNS